MPYIVEGLDAQQFAPLFALDSDALRSRSVAVVVADDSTPGFPCRVSLDHAVPGERLVLINHVHQPADTPYRASHAIYVAERSTNARYHNEMPPALACRLLSLRAFDGDHMMIDADVVEGADAAPVIERLLACADTAYIQAHYAKRGCFAATIRRAD